MEYNTARAMLPITEYGRHVKKMIDFAITIEDREKRNNMAKTIVNVMAQLVPHMRDHNDFKHKLWDHLIILSDFKLDIDAPYPPPDAVLLKEKPKKVSYPANNIRFKHYGKNVEFIIKKISELEEGPVKEAAIVFIANHLKKSYLSWNRDSVNDEVIAEHLEILSEGKLKLGENARLHHTRDILAANKPKIYPSTPGTQAPRSNQSRYNNRGKQNFGKSNVPRNKNKPVGQ
jgi:hypothetical protein